MIKLFSKLFLAGTLFVSVTAAQASPIQSVRPASVAPALPTDLQLKVNQAANAGVASSGVPSASLAIVKDGSIVDTEAFGNARLHPDVAATPDMRYSIGSISKQFTAVAILMLQDQGKLSVDDKISKWLPDLTSADKITIRQVLSHTSGYQDFWPEDYVMTTMMQPTNAQHILDVWGKKPLDFEPGTQWQYSNTNYVIAGRIVEIVTGEELFSLLQKRVFTPLNMQSVMNQDARRLTETDAEGYYRHALGPLRPAPAEGFGWMFAAGELAMTARDLATWDIALMNRDPRILTAHGWTDMETEVTLKDGEASHYGLGVFVLKSNGHLRISHGGEVSGFVSENNVWPDLHAAVAVLTNLDASGGASDIDRDVAKLVFPELISKPKPTDATTAPTAVATAASAPANVPKPAQAENATTTQAKSIFTDLQAGKVDRALLTQLTNNYFTQQALDDYRESLAPLGPVKGFEEETTQSRGGMTFHAYHATFQNGKSVEVTTYIEPDGKIEQYLVSPT